MLITLLEREHVVASLLVVVSAVVAGLALTSLLIARRAVRTESPVPHELLVVTVAGLQLVVILALALVTVQAFIEVGAALGAR